MKRGKPLKGRAVVLFTSAHSFYGRVVEVTDDWVVLDQDDRGGCKIRWEAVQAVQFWSDR